MRHSNIYKRGDSPYFWAWVYDSNGRRRVFSTKKTDLRAAEAVVREEERKEAVGGPRHATAHSLEAALQYLVDSGCDGRSEKTAEMYASRSGPLLRILGTTTDINGLTVEDIRRYLSARRKENASDSTLAKEVVTLRRALKLAREGGRFRGDPSAIVPTDFRPHYEPRDRWLTRDEYQKLQAALPDERRVWVALAVFGSCRAGEVRRTQWEHFDFAEKRYSVPGRKTKKSRRGIPMADELVTILEPLRRARGRVVDPWGNVGRDLKVACRVAGIPPATPNDLRRTFGSWLVQAGVPLKAVADLMGHGSIAMVDRCYGRLADANHVAAVATLPSFTGPRERSNCVADADDKADSPDTPEKPASL